MEKDVMPGEYYYRLKQLDTDGSYRYSYEIKATVGKVPTGYGISQNYPNPFNPSTVINYQIPVSGKVTIKLFDVIGNEVAVLIDKIQEAGSYEITFNAAGLKSGVYFYRLLTDNYVETRKMLLIK